MGDKSEIIDVEYDKNETGGTLDKGTDNGSEGETEEENKPGETIGNTDTYGADLILSYSWNAESNFDYTSLSMQINDSAYLSKQEVSNNSIKFAYRTNLNNVSAYNINLFYTTSDSTKSTQYLLNYNYNVNNGTIAEISSTSTQIEQKPNYT